MAHGSSVRLGVDFGLTNTDVALVADGALRGAWTLPFAGPATPASLERALGLAGVAPSALELIATTGGRHRDLPEALGGTPIRKVGEAQAIGRGGLALAGLEDAAALTGEIFAMGAPAFDPPACHGAAVGFIVVDDSRSGNLP